MIKANDKHNIFTIKIESTSIWNNLLPKSSRDPLGISFTKYIFFSYYGPSASIETIPTKNKNNEKAMKLIDETFTKPLGWAISYFICSRFLLPSNRHNARDVNYNNLNISSLNISKKFPYYYFIKLFYVDCKIFVWLLFIVWFKFKNCIAISYFCWDVYVLKVR